MRIKKPSEIEFSPELEALLSSAAAPEVEPRVRAGIASRLKTSLAPVRPLASTPLLAGEFAAAFIVLGGALIAMMGTRGIFALSMGRAAVLLAGLTAGVALVSVSLALAMAPGTLRRISDAGVAGILAAGFLAVAALLFPWQPSGAFFSEGWPCMVSGLAMAVFTALLFTWLLRRGAPFYSGALGGTVGAAAGWLGIAVLEFRCTYQSAPHQLVWHGGALLLAIAGGAILGRRAHASRRMAP
jgi:hypothetical protein